MASEPQQRGSRRSAAPASAPTRPSRSAPNRTTGSAAKRDVVARPSTTPERDTDDFSRLIQRNTVDVHQQAHAGRRKRNPVVGKIALGLAVVCAAVDASAFAVFMGGDTDFAFGICFVVVFLTLVAAVLGFVAAIGSFGRWYGAIGVVVAFFANPVILVVLLVVIAPEVLTDMGGSAPGSSGV